MKKKFTPDSFCAGTICPAVNFGKRRGNSGNSEIDILLFHYTAMENEQAALRWLCCAESGVSSHYFIFKNGEIVQLVPEKFRAHHAGISYWQGERDINSRSIGIEISNEGNKAFTKAQMQALVKLSRDIIARHKILPQRILGHSDVAPFRKQDPGKFFDWHWLAKNNIGHFVAAAKNTNEKIYQQGSKGEQVKRLQNLLHLYGYECEVDGKYGAKTKTIVEAFQRHFRPSKIDGIVDSSTFMMLENLCSSLAIV